MWLGIRVASAFRQSLPHARGHLGLLPVAILAAGLDVCSGHIQVKLRVGRRRRLEPRRGALKRLLHVLFVQPTHEHQQHNQGTCPPQASSHMCPTKCTCRSHDDGALMRTLCFVASMQVRGSVKGGNECWNKRLGGNIEGVYSRVLTGAVYRSLRCSLLTETSPCIQPVAGAACGVAVIMSSCLSDRPPCEQVDCCYLRTTRKLVSFEWFNLRPSSVLVLRVLQDPRENPLTLDPCKAQAGKQCLVGLPQLKPLPKPPSHWLRQLRC